MDKRNLYIVAGAVILVFIFIATIKPKSSEAPSVPVNTDTQNQSVEANTPNSVNSERNPVQTTKTAQKQSALGQTAVDSGTTSSLPTLDFINKRIIFPLNDFPDVKMTVEEVAFGRRESVTSTGCSGIPNADFSTYLYPGSGVCINNTEVDGSPRGIVAFHILVENNGQIGFGGSSSSLRLHYLRSDSSGQPAHRFAIPLADLGGYYINQFTSRKIVLSYLVPEDQLVYDLVYGYKAPPLENKSLNVYDFSSNGLFADFGSKTLKIIK